MALTTTYERIVFVCDVCGDDLETGIDADAPNAVRAALIKLNAAGWRHARFSTGGHKHYCEDCK